MGRSHECDHPPAVQQLPVCTKPKFADGTSYQIDERIKAILQEGLAVYRVDAEVLDELAPDVIITQTQCDVCAVTLADVEEAVCHMIGSRPRIVALEPNALADIFVDIEKVATALDVPQEGVSLVAALRRRMAEVERTAAELDARPTVACIEWIDPLMAAGNWMPELVQMAGGVSVVGRPGEHAPWLQSPSAQNVSSPTNTPSKLMQSSSNNSAHEVGRQHAPAGGQMRSAQSVSSPRYTPP